jgi:hydantoinase/carbamoylase family amidase
LLSKASATTLQNDIEKLNQFNSTPDEGTTRVLFTETEIMARNYIKKRMVQTGLEVREDAIGNIYGCLIGSSPKLPVIWTGSHIDTVNNAGMFDGMTGVVGGLEALKLIKDSGIEHKRSIELIIFTSEEPTRFGLGCLGSRAMAGKLTIDDARALTDKNGKSLEQVLKSLGYDTSKFSDIVVKNDSVFASVELHIEQGAVLENLGIKLGIVETICGPTNIEIKITGQQEHAGSTPMNMRHDALAACAEMILKLEELSVSSSSSNTVGTVGKLNVFPNSSNVIPGEVEFTVDIRDSKFKVKDMLLDDLIEFMNTIAKNRGVTISYRIKNHDHPVQSSVTVVDTIEKVCNDNNIKFHKMVSGAFHDSMLVAEFAPMAMIFVPSKKGISHSPEEWTDFEDIALGVDVLAQTLLKLSNC